MRRLLVHFCFLLLIPLASFAQNDRRFETFTYHISEYHYAYYLPSDFDPEKTYPVLIGPGEGTEGSDRSFFWDNQDPQQFGWILIEFPLWKQNSTILETLMKELNNVYNVEGDKFHLVGFSANSYSAFGHAISNPKYFHSVTGVPGHPREKNRNQLQNLKDLKVQNIVGSKDNDWLERAREFDTLYQELGIEATLDIIQDGEHVLSELVGKGFMEKMERMRK